MNFSTILKIYKKTKKFFYKLSVKKTLKTEYYKKQNLKKKCLVKKYIRLGFVDWTVDFYDFPKNNYINYFPELNGQDDIRRLNGRYQAVLADKKIFNQIYLNEFNIPEILFEFRHNKIEELKSRKIMTLDSFLNVMPDNLIFKPKNGGQGASVHLITRKNQNFYLDHIVIAKQDLITKILSIEKDLIFTEVVKQNKVLSDIYPYSVNTTRILTYCEKGEIKIAGAAQRIGTIETGVVDNGSRGGLFADIDLETGIMSYARRYSDKIQHKLHPDTKIRIEGCVIPQWNNLLKLAVEGHKKASYLDVIGWDLCVSDEGKLIVIEANNNPSIQIMQGRKGLKNSEFGKFVSDRVKYYY